MLGTCDGTQGNHTLEPPLRGRPTHCYSTEGMAMANRIFLVLTHAPDPTVDYEEDAIVAGASSVLPVLWCVAFSPDDIYWRDLNLEDADGAEVSDEDDEASACAYPVLVTPLRLAIQRTYERRPLFFQVFPHVLKTVYDEWLALLDGIDAPYLLVDTLELWGMMPPAEFELLLTECVSAFENMDARYWGALLRQAAITFDAATNRVSFDEDKVAFVLRGYQWLRPVPWTE